MFMGGTTEQWIGLIEWLFLMVILFTGTFVVSCIITNKFLHKKRKNNHKSKKAEKKSWFIDRNVIS